MIMIKEWFANWFAVMAASRLNGYKTKIGALCLVLYGVVVAVGKVYPDLQLPGGATSWQDDLKLVGMGLAGLGIIHKSYKMGVNTPAESVAAVAKALNAAVPATSVADAAKAMGQSV
ncbi:MAG: hypothetical protein WA666_07280 [Nitrospirota bacterium]